MVRENRRAESGASLVEMAVVAPLLVLLAFGIADFGRVLYRVITLSHAARAGAAYAAQSNAHTGDTAGIRQAAEEEAQDITPITVTSQQVCQCPSGGTVSCTTSTCAGYGVPQVLVQVTATTTFQTLAPYPGIPSTVPLSRMAEMRRQ